MRFWRDLRTVSSLTRLLRRIEPDVVHVHSAKAGMVGRLAAARLGVPSVYTVHGWGFGQGRPAARGLLLAAVERMLRPWTGHYIAVSGADADLGVERVGIRPDRITVIHNGIADTDHRAAPESSRIVAMVARDDRQKDYATLIRAIARLDCELWCIGRGTDSAAFASMVESLLPQARERIRLLGARPDVPELLAKVGVFVLSTRYEGLPLSIIEAMRAGLPIVASRVGGVLELVRDGVNGALVEPGDPKALHDRIGELLADPDARRRAGAASRNAYESGYSLQPMIDATVATYANVRARR
jgi:glycosyltransferase involved in cell wall biosynthesis